MPTSVQGLLQKKHMNESEVARVREMMTMLSGTTTTTTPAAHAGGAQLIDLSSLDKDRVLRSTVHPGTQQDALLQERADAVPTPIMQWDQILYKLQHIGDVRLCFPCLKHSHLKLRCFYLHLFRFYGKRQKVNKIKIESFALVTVSL